MVNHGQRYCSWARTHDGDDNDDDDDDGGVAQDGGHKGTSKPKGGLTFRGLSGAQRGYTIC